MLDRCAMVSVAYLERNDFTDIRHVSHDLLVAHDGSREVYVWLEVGNFEKIRVPARIFVRASEIGARVDVISMIVKGDLVNIKHVMNV